MATPADVRAAFEAKLKEGIPNPPGEFHPADLDRVKDDKYIKRILRHQENDVKQAALMLWDILIWRKTVGASDINETNIRLDYIKEGAFFSHGRDIDGHLLLVFKSKLHVKGQKDFEELKRCVIYWFDRIEREENGKPITLFFDMDGCGLGNMDMELIKYLILLMKQYYPYFLHYIIIFNMPWVLSAAFKVVKQLLPAKAIEKMKFTTKDNLKDYVPQEQALLDWGGTNEYVFEFVPETKSSDQQTPKKVTFAEQGDHQHSPGEMLRLNPNDTIMFKTDGEEVSGQFTITNMDESVISFKIRTTTPEKFRVRPSSGTLAKGATQNVLIVVQQGFQLKSATKDRFLVLAVQIPKADLTPKELTEVWQKSSGSKVDEYRLKCQFPEKDLPKNGIVEVSEKPDSVINALNNITGKCDQLQKQVTILKVYHLITMIFSLAGFVIICALLYKKSFDDNAYCERI